MNAVSDDLPEAAADPARIYHVFANLLSNALRFTRPGGSIQILAESDANFIRFSVRDSGAGIPAGDVGHLFEPFFRVPGQDEKSGAGLGLAIVKEIIRAHGGEVFAQSEIAKGSVFGFSLPVWRN